MGGDTDRLVAWGRELRAVHDRLREALEVTRDAVTAGMATSVVTRDLLLFCHGFCSALSGHHDGEDRLLFPAVAQAHPGLADTLRHLQQDHAMIEHLLGALQAAVDRGEPAADLDRHLEGVAAVMESHFRYEERQLLAVLDGLELRAEPGEVLGPL